MLKSSNFIAQNRNSSMNPRRAKAYHVIFRLPLVIREQPRFENKVSQTNKRATDLSPPEPNQPTLVHHLRHLFSPQNHHPQPHSSSQAPPPNPSSPLPQIHPTSCKSHLKPTNRSFRHFRSRFNHNNTKTMESDRSYLKT